MKQKVGTTAATTNNLETKQMEYGLGFAVNKDLSVGLYMNKAKKEGQAVDEKTQSVAVGYSLGPVALSAQYGNVDNMGGESDKDAKVLFMSLTTAF
jgi:predicted porin